MLITRIDPKGVDRQIDKLQRKLHAALLTEWGILTAAWRCYSRCYRNKTADGYIAENYEGTGEYKEVYWDDTLAAISFFGQSGSDSRVVQNQVDVHLIFFVNLGTLKPGVVHRADSEVREDVLNVIGRHCHGFTVISTEQWVENVLKEYSGSRRDDRLKAVDMHPIHCFRINLKLTYH